MATIFHVLFACKNLLHQRQQRHRDKEISIHSAPLQPVYCLIRTFYFSAIFNGYIETRTFFRVKKQLYKTLDRGVSDQTKWNWI